jgi:hypothetical protein
MGFVKSIFSTRELAFLIWIIIALLVMMFNRGLRNSLSDIVRLLFGSKIGLVLIFLIVYVVLILMLLYKIGVWNQSHVKDTFMWFITSAVVLFFGVNKAEDFRFFKEVIKENFKWAVILDFLINFYTFSLIVEIIFVPVVLLLVLTQVYSKADVKNEAVTKHLTNTLAFVGSLLFFFTIYEAIVHYKTFFSLQTFFSFLLPPALTFFLIPFLYFLALFMQYETLFCRINNFTNDPVKMKLLKNSIMVTAKLNLNRLHTIRIHIDKYDWYHTNNVADYIGSLARRVSQK